MPYGNRTALIVVSATVLSACGSEESDPAPGPSGCASFESTFEAIQKNVFERRGCTQAACHGSAASGGLDLRAGAAYSGLAEAPSQGSTLVRVQPAAPNESYLYLKLKAATDPGSVEIANSPMPVGLPPLSEDELEAVRLWILGGAPEKGSIGDPSRGGTSDTIARLLNACLPPAEPIQIAPLEPPAPDQGIQFVSPPWSLASGAERETCIATYYDFSDRVPAEFKSPDGNKFYINGSRLRQDPGSHHWVLMNPLLDASYVTDPAFGAWTCRGGASEGQGCDPLDQASCGSDGLCASESKEAVGCLGFGPPGGGIGAIAGGEGLIENVQATNQFLPPREGVYRELPIRGLLYHNSHAFNLTPREHTVQARLNVFYAKERRRRLQQVIDPSRVYMPAGIPPFQVEERCADHVAPAGAEMIRLTSHTHKRGTRFTVALPSGEMIYENFRYADPLYKEYDPGILFDGATAAERSLHACAVYNNGVRGDGSPDPERVTRHSRMPDRTSCTPVACVSGKIGAPCSGPEDGAACDSSPGAGDGFCDACPITGGPTTENEMFVVMPWYILPEEK
jgi:hypothetical protein